MRPKIVVIGSANTDMIVRTAHIPVSGETVLGDGFMRSGGGKGANQAVAAARLGAEVVFVARLGKDHFGQAAFEAYEREGIKTNYIAWDEETPSGVALIMVDNAGENIICVAPGANGKLSTDDIAGAEDAIGSADCVLLQLEIPMKTVEYAIRLASKHHVRVVLNPAPITTLSKELLEGVDVLTPNETEALVLAGKDVPDRRDLALMIQRRYGVRNVVVTMGKEGAVIAGSDGPPAPAQVPAFQVNSVDAIGAGDAFNAALAVALARGEGLEDAARYASAAGALATTRRGAQPSLPYQKEIMALLST